MSLLIPRRGRSWRGGLEGRFDVLPGHARWQNDCDDVGCAVPALHLLANLIAGSVGGELVEHDLGAGRYTPAPRAGARVRGDDLLDLGGIALAGHRPGVDLAHGAQVPGGAACGDAPGGVGVLVGGSNGPRRYREGPSVGCGGFAKLAELGRPAGQAVAGHQRGDPAVTEFGCHPGRVLAQRGNPDGYLGGGGLPQAQRTRGGGAAQLGRLAGQQSTDLGHNVAQLGGRVLEGDVVEPLRQRLGAGAQAKHVPPSGDLVEGGGGHGQRRRGASPHGQDT